MAEDDTLTPSNSGCVCIPTSREEDQTGAEKLCGGDLSVTSGQVQRGGEGEDAGTAGITALNFESQFECGNLRKAVQVLEYVCMVV